MRTVNLIDTDLRSERLRARAVDLTGHRILITDFRGTVQEKDLSVPPNCGGYGRVRHFRRATSPGWPENPIPIDPARRSLGLPGGDEIEAQVFQNAACNWRCWYCFVPYELLSANERRAAWFTSEELLQLYVAEQDRAHVIDLTGGEPGLVPEWIPWMMEALRAEGLDHTTYLWSDDNLSIDYYTRFLSDRIRAQIAEYPHHGRVCCFKGYDAESFSFNTRASPALFERQFSIFRTLLDEGLDMYAYVTFTSPNRARIKRDVPRFVDKLQSLHPNLPLRTVPLEVEEYTPVGQRLRPAHREAMENQWRACEEWQKELERRFTVQERCRSIADVPMTSPSR